MGKWLKGNFILVLAWIAAIFLVFLLGLVLGLFRITPANYLQTTIEEMRDLKRNWTAYFMGVPSVHLRPRVHPGNGVVLSDEPRVSPGVTFVTGLFDDVLGFRLYAADGSLLREWPVNFFKIAPDEMKYPFHALIHGAKLYENGDIAANFDGRGVVRVNACGQILWQNRDRSNHSIFADSDGVLWTPVYLEKQSDTKLFSQPFGMDGVASFDPDTGEKLSQINLFETLVNSDNLGLLQKSAARIKDVVHLNDVEVLGADMAGAFPQFNTGDIMLSLRNLNQLWILDADTQALKWWFSGPMMGQHDPDFQPDGTITVLDNRPSTGHLKSTDNPGRIAGSRILKIDPKTRTSSTLYQSDVNNTFFTPYRGKHQLLDNGNILIAESDRGRVFEVAPDGKVVWSFVNGWDDERVAWVMGASKYPESFGEFSSIQCE